MHAFNEELTTEKGKFDNKARRTIKDMGGKWSPTERRNFVRSLVKSYGGLDPAEADTFIDDNDHLIQHGC